MPPPPARAELPGARALEAEAAYHTQRTDAGDRSGLRAPTAVSRPRPPRSTAICWRSAAAAGESGGGSLPAGLRGRSRRPVTRRGRRVPRPARFPRIAGSTCVLAPRGSPVTHRRVTSVTRPRKEALRGRAESNANLAPLARPTTEPAGAAHHPQQRLPSSSLISRSATPCRRSLPPESIADPGRKVGSPARRRTHGNPRTLPVIALGASGAEAVASSRSSAATRRAGAGRGRRAVDEDLGALGG